MKKVSKHPRGKSAPILDEVRRHHISSVACPPGGGVILKSHPLACSGVGELISKRRELSPKRFHRWAGVKMNPLKNLKNSR